MNKLAFIPVCLFFAAPVLAQSTSPSTPDFVKEVAVSDIFEIQSSQLATERADAPTKAFASRMITDHQKTSSELKSKVQGGTVKATLPAALDAPHDKMLDTLKGLKGADFTKQYQSDQVNAHTEAVSLFERYAQGGDNTGLKDWAAQTLPTLRQHLKMAQDLKK